MKENWNMVNWIQTHSTAGTAYGGANKSQFIPQDIGLLRLEVLID